MNKNKNEYNQFAFWGAEPVNKNLDYIKTKNVFIIPNQKIKKDLEKTDKEHKHTINNKSIFQKQIKEEDVVKETKKQEKKQEEKSDMLERKLEMLKKNKHFKDSGMF